MNRNSTISTVAILAASLATSGAALAAPDLSPLACVWSKLPATEQDRLRAGFKVDLGRGNFTLSFAAGDPAPAFDAMQQCQLTLDTPKSKALAEGLSRHAAALQAKLGILDRGEKPESVELALDKMHEGKRELIGDSLSCPGPHSVAREWDSSVASGIGRAKLQLRHQSAKPWVSLAMYAVMAEEGAARRMAGQTEPCS